MSGQDGRRWGRVGLLLGAVLLAAAAAVSFIPSVVYVIPTGASMEPGISQGDIVFLRKAASYQVGDVVAYRSEALDRIVLHRIVAIRGDRLVTRGDNNEWDDSEQPSLDHVVGRRWFRVPGLGGPVARLWNPLPAAVLIAVATYLLVEGSPRLEADDGERAPTPASA